MVLLVLLMVLLVLLMCILRLVMGLVGLVLGCIHVRTPRVSGLGMLLLGVGGVLCSSEGSGCLALFCNAALALLCPREPALLRLWRRQLPLRLAARQVPKVDGAPEAQSQAPNQCV